MGKAGKEEEYGKKGNWDAVEGIALLRQHHKKACLNFLLQILYFMFESNRKSFMYYSVEIV